MILSVKGFITHKDGEAYRNCADRMAIECRPSALRAAVADGVSCGSFLQAHWAQFLTEEFVRQDDEITSVPLDVCRKKWYEAALDWISRPDAHWMAKNLFYRHTPGHATLVSLVLSVKHHLWYAESIGDSCLFFVPKGKDNESDKWITITPKNFGNEPDYYASYDGKDKGKIMSDINAIETGCFYIMTDALSKWLYTQKGEAISVIQSWENQEMFETSITQLRDNGLLDNDDSTILIINLEDDGLNHFIYDSKNITNINDLI